MIEQSADIVMFISVPEIWDDEYFKQSPFTDVKCSGKAIIDIQKGRNCGQTKFILNFNRSINRFSNFNRETDN